MNTVTNRQKSIISIFIVFILIYIGASIGSSNISMLDTISIIANKALGIPLREGILAKDVSIIWKIRLPRVLLAFLVGGCLAASGAVVQSILKNQLASPFTLGVSSGASLGAGLVIVTGFSIPFVGSFTLPIVGFIFGLFTVYIVIVFSNKIDSLLKRIHGSNEYRGRRALNSAVENFNDFEQENKKEVKEETKLEKLQKDLKKAIADERYEDAAKIRDEIKELEDK